MVGLSKDFFEKRTGYLRRTQTFYCSNYYNEKLASSLDTLYNVNTSLLNENRELLKNLNSQTGAQCTGGIFFQK